MKSREKNSYIKLVKLLLPRRFYQTVAFFMRSLVVKPHLEYASCGWETNIRSDDNEGWNSKIIVNEEKDKWAEFVRNTQGTGPLGFAHESDDLTEIRNVYFHNIHITYAYVLALAARQKNTISVLDYGGGLGHYYLLGKAILPECDLDFHCKELPNMVDTGKLINPDIHWYSDESYLLRTYNLVMVSSSLQYIKEWNNELQKICQTVDEYLFLTRLSVVEKSSSSVAIQMWRGVELLNHQFNRKVLLETVEGAGLSLVREFVVGDMLNIKHAPENSSPLSFLFKKKHIKI